MPCVINYPHVNFCLILFTYFFKHNYKLAYTAFHFLLLPPSDKTLNKVIQNQRDRFCDFYHLGAYSPSIPFVSTFASSAALVLPGIISRRHLPTFYTHSWECPAMQNALPYFSSLRNVTDLFNASRRCSMGLRSGNCWGHSRIVITLFVNHNFVYLGVYLGR